MRVGKVWGSVHGVKVLAREKREQGLGLPDMAPLPVLSRSTPAKTGAATASEPAAAAACDVKRALCGMRMHSACTHACVHAQGHVTTCAEPEADVQPKLLGQFHLRDK